jgi:hypothetical protein
MLRDLAVRSIQVCSFVYGPKWLTKKTDCHGKDHDLATPYQSTETETFAGRK